jgi:hypothetical protein
MANLCANPACRLPVSGHRVLCSKDWNALPEDVRRRIQSEFETRLLRYRNIEAARVIAREHYKK